jgi:hypothetical protein
MPDRGLLDPNDITAVMLRGKHPAPWSVANATICQVTFEVAQGAALAALPGDVTRPIPCYARLFLLDAADGPAGPFRMAALLVGGRFRMLPRNVLVRAVVDGPLDAVSGAFGAPFMAGGLSLRRDGARVTATIAEGAETVAEIVLPELRAVDPSMLRWDAWLGFAGPGDNIDLIEYAPKPEPRTAFLSKGATVTMLPSAASGDPWAAFRNLNTISACYAEGPLTLTAPDVQQALL